MPDQAIVALHSAVDVDGLWRAASALLADVVEHGLAVLYLQAMRDDAPSVSTSARELRIDPALWRAFTPLARKTSGVGTLDVANVPLSGESADAFRRFRERWPFGAIVSLEACGYASAAILLFKSKAAGRFTRRDVERIRRIHPHLTTCLRNVRVLQREHVTRLALQRLLSRLPLGILLLDWDGAPLFHNAAANEICAAWNFGPEKGRLLSASRVFRVPKEIRVAARSMYAVSALGAPEHERIVETARAPGLRATINFVRFDAQANSRPRFLIHLERDTASNDRRETTNLAAMVKLSPREREIVERICRGESNAEIARALGKSILTVKKQLQSIFRKTRVKSRTQLALRFG